MLPALDGAICVMSEPMVSHDVVAFYLLSREVAKHVKVVQSGQGADEIFAGYDWYPPFADADAGANGNGLDLYEAEFFDRPRAEMEEALSARYLADTDVSRVFVAEHFARPRAHAPLDRALRLDTQVILVDDPVKRVDNMTMAWGPASPSSTTSSSSSPQPVPRSSSSPRTARGCSRRPRAGSYRRR